MNCLTARETLDLVRPHEVHSYELGGDESQGATIDEAAQHVKGCPACQTAVSRREQIDARIGQLSRDLPVPGGLRERLLARLTNEIASGSQPVQKPAVRSRRRMVAVVAACVVAVSSVVAWRLMLSPPSLLSLDEIAGYALTEDFKPDDLPELTQFKGGLDLRPPKTMRALPLMQPIRRLVDPQLGDREIAVYSFTVSRRRGGSFKGRLVIVPAAAVKDLPTASSFPGPTVYKLGFCTTAWVEGKFVYLCCVRAGEDELHLLRPARADPA